MGASMKVIGFLFCAISLLFSCSDTVSENQGLVLENGCISVELDQRTEIGVEGYTKDLTIYIDDITMGECLMVLYDNDKVIQEIFIKEEEVVDFVFDGVGYTLRCANLFNKLIGTDIGYFQVCEVSGKKSIVSPNEVNDIEAFLKLIGEQDVVFIRNGVGYTPDRAVDHLRMKWNTQKGKINAIDEFIKHIASGSSSSNAPYKVQFSDSTILNAEDWYKQLGY